MEEDNVFEDEILDLDVKEDVDITDSMDDSDTSDEEVEKKPKKRNRKKMSAKLESEYEEAFDDDEKLVHNLSHIRSTITFENKEINIDDIAATPFKRVSREDSIRGLSSLVEHWGVFNPIHVLALEDDDCYQLLDGLRRVFAAQKANKKTINAIVWNFSDKKEGKEMANILSLAINRCQKFTPKEMWEQMKLLESVNEASPGMIEFLLQMNPGDAMKLKDVMLADNSYSDFKDGLMNGKYSIDQAYKKLCNERKKEDKLDKEDRLSIDSDGLVDTAYNTADSYADGDDSGSSYSEDEKLSNDEVKKLLELNPTDEDEDLDDVSLEDLDKTNEIRKDEMHQKVGERTFIDSSVKKATLIRDNNRCRCCGVGGAQWAGILVYHHVIPVYAGGPDTVENGITLCVNCHLTLHNYITGDVQIPTDLDERETKIFKNIMKYGNIAIEASNKLGMKRDELRKANASSKKHPMPNTNVALNKQALAEAEELHEHEHEHDIDEDDADLRASMSDNFDADDGLDEDGVSVLVGDDEDDEE